MPHEFTNPVLKKHFLKSPIPAGAIRLIDIPPDVFLDTEEEVNVIAASLWIMSILYDKLPEKEVPKTKEDLRKVSNPAPARAEHDVRLAVLTG
jgi:hypothetical protein